LPERTALWGKITCFVLAAPYWSSIDLGSQHPSTIHGLLWVSDTILKLQLLLISTLTLSCSYIYPQL
jgi:hypothetical protein